MLKRFLNLKKDTHVYNRRAIAHRRNGRFNKAIEIYKKALKINPSDNVLYYNLGRAYVEAKDKQKAIHCFKKALEIDPNFKEAEIIIEKMGYYGERMYNTEYSRQFLRVRPLISAPIRVFLGSGAGMEVADIGAGGLAFYTPWAVKEGAVFQNIFFPLPMENVKIRTKAVVQRFIEKAAPSQRAKHKCCVKYLEMAESQTNLIIRYVLKREREILRER